MELAGSGVVIQNILEVAKQRKYLLLLDRDGTLNLDKGHTYKLDELSIIEENAKNIEYLINKETSVYCISNQSGIGRNLYTIEEVKLFNSALAERLREYGINIEKFIFCPHLPNKKCLCRKPRTLMLELAIKETRVKVDNCTFIGNSTSDMLASYSMGIKYIGVDSLNFKKDILKRKNEVNASF